MKSDPIQDYILKNKRNLGIAAAVGEVWPEARGELVSGFLDRLDTPLKKKLKGWQSMQQGETFFIEAYAGYYIWKPAWKNQYSIGLQCNEYGKSMVFGVERELDYLGKRPHCEELFAAVKEVHPSASTHAWWEARMTMRSPASDWRKPEVLWQMHKDSKFLDDVAEQLLELAKISEPIVDKLVRKYKK
jgi:hypothetical protein